MTSRRTVLKTGVGLVAATLLKVKPVMASSSENTLLRAGVGRSNVNLTDLLPIGDFTGEHDALFIRALLLNDGQLSQAMVVVDLTSLALSLVADMKAIVQEITGIPASQVIIIASHSFSTPHIPDTTRGDSLSPQDKKLIEAYCDALRIAIKQAFSGLVPAKMGAGAGFSRIGVNRDVETASGWWLGADESGFSDPHTGVVRIDGRDGQPLAVLINYAVQPAVMDASRNAAGGRLISADLAGFTVSHVETYFGAGTVAFYLPGAAGDQVPYLQANRHVSGTDGKPARKDVHEAGFVIAEMLGERLGNEVGKVCSAIKTGPVKPLALFRKSVSVPVVNFSAKNAPTGPLSAFRYTPAGYADMPITLMRWGDIVFVCVQPELNAVTGALIRNASPFPHTFIVTMADGAAKYMPDKQSYTRFTYEARSSPFAPGAAEKAAAFIVAQLENIKEIAG
ncbi:hypothetical protein [Pantoea cypripedii]|uniref:Neutral/alkaline non-lysosomal ceramidase N-terminal domain-containing protein n=1 Tax=Pantoea cypripedii TaxID=55209 RepID=A0A6B9GGS8_PANCY|nr:hypothetical protein [Pantoea cypripedii]QGY32785.1 hypothetical protein CUN67_28010 [Pantoea cypripedii]